MQLVIYEKIDLIVPENHKKMKLDLENRLRHPVLRFEIGNINFLNETAEVEVYY